MADLPEGFPPCPEWQDGPVDPDDVQTVEEFARWLNYLLHPEKHDGLRRYVCVSCRFEDESPVRFSPEENSKFPHGPAGNIHTSTEWEEHSVIEGFDPSSAFHALHEASGMPWKGSMDNCFLMLKDSYFCRDTKENGASSGVYPKDRSFEVFSGNLNALLAGIGEGDPRRPEAMAYHDKVKQYAECHENQMFALAEALSRYHAAHSGAREMILTRMRKTVELFKEKLANRPDGGVPWGDVLEVGIGLGITAIFSAVPVAGPVAGRVAYGLLTDVTKDLIVGALKKDETGKEFETKSPDGPTSKNSWREIVDWFVGEMNRISTDLDFAIDPRADTYGGMSMILYNQFARIQQVTHTDGVTPVPALPGYVPRN